MAGQSGSGRSGRVLKKNQRGAGRGNTVRIQPAVKSAPVAQNRGGQTNRQTLSKENATQSASRAGRTQQADRMQAADKMQATGRTQATGKTQQVGRAQQPIRTKQAGRTKSAGGGTAIKGFQGRQTLVAVVAVLVVIAVFTLLLCFGKSIGANKKDDTKKDSTVSQTKEEGDVKLKDNTEPYDDSGSILIQGTRAMEVFSVAPTSLTKYGQEINQWAEANPKIKVYALLAPTSLEFYGPDDYRTENHSALRAMKIVYEQMTARNITTVETRNPIAKHVDEYIYFRTDHHWTARGAYYAYTAFCKAAGLKATNLKDHQSGTIQDFVGSYYRYTNSATLKENPDYVEYFMPLSQVTGTVWSDADTSKEGRSVEAINTNITQSNKYLCFIAGDNPVERFVTSNKNGKKIVIIKESYGNAFAPWLMDNYEEVWVLDPRKVDTNLTDFITKNGINEVLFLNYAFAPSNPTYMTAFTKMLS